MSVIGDGAENCPTCGTPVRIRGSGTTRYYVADYTRIVAWLAETVERRLKQAKAEDMTAVRILDTLLVEVTSGKLTPGELE